MGPYYHPNRVSLSEGDRRRSRAVYGVTGSPQAALSTTITAKQKQALEQALGEALREAVKSGSTRLVAAMGEYLIKADADIDLA